MFHKSDPLRPKSVGTEEICKLGDRRNCSSGSRAVQLCMVSRYGTSIDGGASDSGLISLARDLDQFPSVNVKDWNFGRTIFGKSLILALYVLPERRSFGRLQAILFGG